MKKNNLTLQAKERLTVFFLLMLMTVGSWAQQAIFDVNNLTSPEVHQDGSVTFRLHAPKAITVSVAGDFGVIDMKEGKDGIWSCTTPSLEPEMYSYRFKVDGMDLLDPSNVYRCRDIASFMNIFIVTKAQGDKGWLYGVNKVRHGNVSKVWYPSPTLKTTRRMTVYMPAGYRALSCALSATWCGRRRGGLDYFGTGRPDTGQSYGRG